MGLSSTFKYKKYKLCNKCRYLSYITYCASCDINKKTNMPSRFFRIKPKYVFLLKYQYGIHRVIRESDNCYWVWDKELQRRRGYIKTKQYVIKLWW